MTIGLPGPPGPQGPRGPPGKDAVFDEKLLEKYRGMIGKQGDTGSQGTTGTPGMAGQPGRHIYLLYFSCLLNLMNKSTVYTKQRLFFLFFFLRCPKTL